MRVLSFLKRTDLGTSSEVSLYSSGFCFSHGSSSQNLQRKGDSSNPFEFLEIARARTVRGDDCWPCWPCCCCRSFLVSCIRYVLVEYLEDQARGSAAYNVGRAGRARASTLEVVHTQQGSTGRLAAVLSFAD